ncbi:MAG: hypothetical protein Q9167_003464 [Letrouitia subvulpina]
MAPHAVDAPPSTNGPEVESIHRRGDANNSAGMASDLTRYPETGITVLIVGAGVGGLLSAMEGWRKGHSIQILERSVAPVLTGDICLLAITNVDGGEIGDNLTLQPSAMSIIRHWPELCKEIEKEQYDCTMAYYKNTGEHIFGPVSPSFNEPENVVGRKGPHVALMQSRVKLYKSLIRQTERLGIHIEYNQRVVSYYEDESSGIGGVVLEGGERREADVVIAADGTKTCSGKFVSGEDAQPTGSSLAIYRAAYPVEHALSEPLVKERWGFRKGDRPMWEFWIGTGLHALVVLTDDVCIWGLTHQDDGSATESWDPDVDPADVVSTMEREAPGWHPAVAGIMKTAPKGTIIHWKLMWRDLCETWTSPGGRVVQVGDSAHSFLPSSGNGASQAIEDAITLATCLQLGGKSNVPIATKVYNTLRYNRVSCAQLMSFVNAQNRNQTNWTAVDQNPALVRTRFPRWMYQHDPEAYAYSMYGQAFQHVVSGGATDFQNTNVPPGHTFRKWTIDEVKGRMKRGEMMEQLLDGDWS